MLELYDQIDAAAAAFGRNGSQRPHAGIILGTGLGGLVDEDRYRHGARLRGDPPLPQIDGHQPSRPPRMRHARRHARGRHGRPVPPIRRLFAEADHAARPRDESARRAQLLVVSNACRRHEPLLPLGRLMVIEDHINLMGDNPLIGINDDRLGPRFPDMCEPYDLRLIERGTRRSPAQRKLRRPQRRFRRGNADRTWKRAAEYRFLRQIGADVVGMSTVPEVIVAVHCDLRVVGFSIVTDMCLPDALEPADVPKIIAIANEAEPRCAR